MNSLKNKLSGILAKAYVRRILTAILLLCLITVTELFLSNARLIGLDTDEYKTDYKLNTATLPLNDGDDLSFSYLFPSSGVYAIRIISSSEERFNTPVKLKIKSYDESRSASLITVATTYFAPNMEETVFVNYSAGSNINIIEFDISNVEGNATIDEITVNPTEGLFRFSLTRALIILVICMLVWLFSMFGFNKDFFDYRRKSHKAVGIVTVILCVGFVVAYCLLFVGADYNIDYPLEDGVDTYSPYVQQFDAFLKGQLHIDYPVDEELLQLENPYDYGQRDGVSYMWDRAMYDGKYYSYFGIAPIINVYTPHYLITGTVASDALIVIVYAVIAALFLCLFIFAYVAIYKKRVHVSMLALGTFGAVVCSCIPLMARSTAHFYYIAVLSAMAYMAQFMFFILLAINLKHRIMRPVFFALAGANYAMLFLSRLNMALLCAFIVIPILYFAIIRNKSDMDISSDLSVKRTLKGKIIDLSALGALVVAAIVFSMIYNSLRFDSPFEFGTSYQLTVSDISKNKVDFFGFTSMLYNVFFQPFKASGCFPFFTLESSSTYNYGDYTYVDSGMGLFAIPLMSALVLSVFLFKDKNKTRFAKALGISTLAGTFIVLLLNFYLGGVIYRYTCDVTLLCAVFAILLIFSFNEKIYGTEVEKGILVVERIFISVSVTVMILVMISLHGYLADMDARIFCTLEEMFV